MISKSHGHVGVISLHSFHQSYPARIRVNCLDKSIAFGFEEGNILFAFFGSSFRDGRILHKHIVHICTSVYIGMLLLCLHHIRNISGMLFLYTTSRTKVKFTTNANGCNATL